jgi:hypothetical protein
MTALSAAPTMRSFHSMHHTTTRIAAALAVALFTAGCGDDPPPLTNPDPPASITEEFSGTLTPFSARLHLFNAQAAGTISVNVVALDPAETVVGVALGTSTGGTVCQTAVSIENAGQGTTLNGVARSAGTLCARIYDPTESGFPAPVPYTIRVTHF